MTNGALRVVVENLNQHEALSLQEFLPSLVSAIVGALFGAIAAYLLYRSQREREDRNAHQIQLNKKHNAGNKALFAIYCQTCEISEFKKWIKPYANKPERSKILPTFERDYSLTPKINVDSLSFLLDADMCPNLLDKLFCAQQSFETTAAVIKKREHLRTEIAYQEVSGTINSFTKRQLEIYTNSLFERVDLTYEKLRDIKEPLTECLRKIEPGLEPITFEIIDDA